MIIIHNYIPTAEHWTTGIWNYPKKWDDVVQQKDVRKPQFWRCVQDGYVLL